MVDMEKIMKGRSVEWQCRNRSFEELLQFPQGRVYELTFGSGSTVELMVSPTHETVFLKMPCDSYLSQETLSDVWVIMDQVNLQLKE